MVEQWDNLSKDAKNYKNYAQIWNQNKYRKKPVLFIQGIYLLIYNFLK